MANDVWEMAGVGAFVFTLSFLCSFLTSGGAATLAVRFRRGGGWLGLAERLFYALRKWLFASYFLIIYVMTVTFSPASLAIGFAALSVDTLFCALLYIGARRAVTCRRGQEFRIAMQGNPYGTSGYAMSAHERAEATLRAALSPEQRAQYDEHCWFEVTGSEGNRYRIDQRSSYNIQSCDTRRTYCVLPRLPMPLADRMLAQKFWLETDERGTLAIANAQGGY